MVVRKNFEGVGGLESDRVVVKNLSPNLLAVIGSVMAQSVALVRILNTHIHCFCYFAATYELLLLLAYSRFCHACLLLRF